MPEEATNGHGQSRLDRLEGLVEVLVNGHIEFEREHQCSLTAQVVLTDRLDRLTVQVSELRESQKHTDDRLNALIAVANEVARKRPPHTQ